MDKTQSIFDALKVAFDTETAKKLTAQIEDLVQEYKPKIEQLKQNNHYSKALRQTLSQEDVVLIAYANHLNKDENNCCLQNLKKFSDEFFEDIISSIHLLPFFPFSSDDGFSVIDYLKVDEQFGTWQDIQDLGKNFRLMFDYVANHISAQSDWVKGYLAQNPEYENFFTRQEDCEELKMVVRPRSSPLLTPFEQNGKTINLWTTFSADQVDVNYNNPAVVLKMTEILLDYYVHGASMIRLDAILYMWKIIGTDCVHLPQTHAIIQMWRSVTELVFKEAILLAEVSAPHHLNMQYLGNGNNECNMIYQFPLAPLVLYSFLKEDASYLTSWAKEVKVPGKNATFFNLLACHDGIGLMPARGILPEEEISWLAEKTRECAGDVSNKRNSDGSESPYELNIVYFSAISSPAQNQEQNIQRFCCAYSIPLLMRGVPGLYFNALIGAENDLEGVKQKNMKRAINRQKFEYTTLRDEILTGKRNKVYSAFKHMLSIRKTLPCLDPYADMRIADLGSKVFCILRKSTDNCQSLIGCHNISGESITISLPLNAGNDFFPAYTKNATWVNALDGHALQDTQKVELKAYEYCWFVC